MRPEFLGPMISLLVPIALIAAVVYGIVSLTRRRSNLTEADPGIGTVRRLYFYIVSFVALMMAITGVMFIGMSVLETLFGGELLTSSNDVLAWGMALIIVGLPLWAFHWWTISKYVREIPVETHSIIRKVYLYVILGIAAGIGMSGAVSALTWVFGEQSFRGFPWAAIVVWGAVWAFHWRLEEEEGQATPETRAVRRLYVYLASAITLAFASLGVGQIINTILGEAYAGLTSETVLAQPGLWGSTMKLSLSVALVAGPGWAAHWLYFARRDYDSILRQLYLYAFSILGSIITVLVALGIILNGILVWAFGTPDEISAAVHFEFLSPALASFIIAGGILAYHWTVAHSEARTPTPASKSAQGSYPYVLTAIGMVALISGISTLVAAVLGIFVESGQQAIAGEETWKKAIAMSITMGVLGIPLWGYYWSGIQRRVKAGGVDERAGLPRRIFIFGVLVAGMLAMLWSVSFVVFIFFKEVLDGELSQFLWETKGAIAIIVPAVIFLPYYWLVYREDRREMPARVEEKPHLRKAVTVLVTGGGDAFLRDLEAALGQTVSTLQWVDPDADLPELSEEAFQDVARQVNDSPGANVLLVPDPLGVRVLSYR